MLRLQKLFFSLLVVLCIDLSLSSVAAFAENETVFTYRAPESEVDLRYNYDTDVLRLALEKTKAKWGPYKLVPSPVMNFPRAFNELKGNLLPNFFMKVSYEDQLLEQGLDYARFDVDLGIVGWRVCFGNAASIEKLKSVKTLDDLKKLSYGQGAAWADVEILRSNGFSVQEVSSYESLFQMVARHRFDLFCRGANELLDEWESHKNIEGLMYDKSIVIQYPLPRFFFTSAANTKARDRVTEGLIAAYKDGSLMELWKRDYQKSIDFVDLGKRKIFKIENPHLKKVDPEYKKYMYDPHSKRGPNKK